MTTDTITLPVLKDGETNAGIIFENGSPHHWVILLPGDNDDAKWQAAVDWAASIGGELPTRREQSLLFANCKGQFQEDWYWSGERHASYERYAWCQTFYGGGQTSTSIDRHCRARAVRRVLI